MTAAPQVTVRPAEPGDSAMLAELGAKTFHDSFADHNEPADMAAYLEASFAPEIQAREIADPGWRYFIAEVAGQPVGFVLARDVPPPDCVTGPAPIELARFYVDRPWHGRGIAPLLMDACIAEARRRGGKTLWLGVYEHNKRAVRFYEKAGFRDVGSHFFMLGSDRQVDRVMVRDIG
jgi:GNAT superfamily N-acetyltransferase